VSIKPTYEEEHYEFSKMYPEFLETSKKDDSSDATQTFHWASEVEKAHGQLCQKAIVAVKAGEVIPERDYYICQKCGYTAEDGAPDKCPVCGADKDVFSKV
jgi:rubrerythrin